ncbi:MAG: hypothetical protein WDW36_007777 [Sanguina aurantia]
MSEEAAPMASATATVPTILIANRGEVAWRVIRTCNKLGIRTVAVFTSTDALSPHVREATVSVFLGDKPREYTNAEKLLQIAVEQKCDAVHPGYGFLSENEAFCAAITAAGIQWLGPNSQTMHDFSLKHVARELARSAGVPILEGSGLVQSATEAAAAAAEVGYPVLLKATGGGGGMGIFTCLSEAEVHANFQTSQKQGLAFFGNAGVFVEKYIQKAHHIEVQIFGDGCGGCIHLGERECSIQRRHQKVLEETPSPLVSPQMRAQLTAAAVQLGQSSSYRSAGTVEFLVDEDSGRFYFLEVNTRLQVEHGITELTHGSIDIVEAQLRLQVPALQPAGGPQALLATLASARRSGHAIEVRINGEDPSKGFRPCPGVLGFVSFPSDMPGVRIDTWVETGTDVSPNYDSLLGKLMVFADTRAEAIEKMKAALGATRLQGVPNNLEFLRAVVADAGFALGDTTTRFLDNFVFHPRIMEIMAPGLQTSVQDWPGRVGRWSVGVPPSGPMDALSHRLANALVGNDESAATLEFALSGPTLKFHVPSVVALTGASFPAELDGVAVECWRSFVVAAGQTLTIGAVQGNVGVRGYLAVSGGIDVPLYLGSRSTFPSGSFGGYQGRYLRTGDALPLGLGSESQSCSAGGATLGEQPRPVMGGTTLEDGSCSWEVGVLPGPHADPDFITSDFMADEFHSSPYKVHYNSNRLGIRMVGPKPAWVRADGGEGGSHPSNVHDHVYAIGAINFTGDHPVVLTVDGPSLGGFVCPATIVSTELWKMGQVRPGDSVTFRKLSLPQAFAAVHATDALVRATCAAATGAGAAATGASGGMGEGGKEAGEGGEVDDGEEAKLCARPVLLELAAEGSRPLVQYRLAGDRYVQVEYGPMELDLNLRVRVHCLEAWLKGANVAGLMETSPGVRSCMVEYDVRKLTLSRLLKLLVSAELVLPDVSTMVLPSRTVRLPMAFDECWTHEAIERYMKSIRPSGPYLPSNIDYIAANNGLTGGRDEVRDTLFSSSYLVLGLGDVYLGAPCAVPLDPRQRLVTAKYNPARTFTHEGTVGIGGCYMCIYPMDSPGGYQLVGRTLPIWNTFARAGPFTPAKPWLLQSFDQVRFFQVSESELEDMRSRFASGRYTLDISEGVFDVAAYNAMVVALQPEVDAIKARQQKATEVQLIAETDSLLALAALDEAAGVGALGSSGAEEEEAYNAPGLLKVLSMFSANVWDIKVAVGQAVRKGDTLLILEAMKMESSILAAADGVVRAVCVTVSQLVGSGSTLVVIEESA